MHPAPSLIVFTTLSGLGFGLMIFLGLAGAHGVDGGWVAGIYCALALGLAGAGLAASTLHLRRPERAWRAFSQWRSSWLSREGVLAVATMAAFGLYAALWALGSLRLPWLGALSALLAVATVYCTAMIYAQLRSVPRWAHWSTQGLFVTLALAGGAMLAGETSPAGALLAAALGFQVVQWRAGDAAWAGAAAGLGAATGLAGRGTVRAFESPHTGRSYLTDEMVHVVGRRRSAALRRLAVILGYVLPAVVFLTLEAWPFKHAVAGLAVLSHVAGAMCSRWLFYAEAEHVVGLYYGRGAA